MSTDPIPLDYVIERHGGKAAFDLEDVLAPPDDKCRVTLRVFLPARGGFAMQRAPQILTAHFHALVVDNEPLGQELGYMELRDPMPADLERLERLRDQIDAVLA